MQNIPRNILKTSSNPIIQETLIIPSLEYTLIIQYRFMRIVEGPLVISILIFSH